MTTQIATFGAGCFWGVESAFLSTRGVVNTSVGYSGGHVPNANYEMVCTGETGHAEVVQVEYDPAVVTYDDLLAVFWDKHDPTQMNRQGPDVGTQYRSVIYYHTPEQEQNARASMEALRDARRWRNPIVTQIEPIGPYYFAEDYHQQYLEKRGRFLGANREMGF